MLSAPCIAYCRPLSSLSTPSPQRLASPPLGAEHDLQSQPVELLYGPCSPLVTGHSLTISAICFSTLFSFGSMHSDHFVYSFRTGQIILTPVASEYHPSGGEKVPGSCSSSSARLVILKCLDIGGEFHRLSSTGREALYHGLSPEQSFL